jgi:hypothetical protein
MTKRHDTPPAPNKSSKIRWTDGLIVLALVGAGVVLCFLTAQSNGVNKIKGYGGVK